jgi:EmrB/QacA subfamily drug resistance transporter
MTATIRPPAALRWWTLAVVSIGTFMLMLDLSVVAVALPSMHNSLHASFGQMQWVFDAYALTLAALLVTAGSVADRSGRKRIFLSGLIIFTAASLACGLAGSIDVLNVSRGAQGIGAAIMFAVGPALLGHEFHGKERAKAFGAFGASLGLAVATGPLIGGALTNGPGWRWIFFLNVPVGVVTVLIAWRQLRESRLASAAPPDFIGMITFTASLAALVLAIIRGNTDGWFSRSNIALYAAAAVCLIIFLLVARARGERAMFDLGMFRSRTFLGLSALTFLANCAGLPSIFIETTFMQSVLHSTAWQAGLRFLPLTLGMFVFGALAGGLTGRVPFWILMGASQVALGAGLLLTHLSGAGSSWTTLIPSLIVTGAAFGIFNPTRAALAIGVAEPARAGVASGINETFQQVGTALGIAIGGAFFENRVTSSLLNSSVAAHLGRQGPALASAVSAGSIDTAAHSAGPGLFSQVLADGRAAFTVGFHDTMTLCAVFAFAAAAIAIVSLRAKDLHASALTGIPPELPEDAEVQQGQMPAATK